jgi:hypothetical protein
MYYAEFRDEMEVVMQQQTSEQFFRTTKEGARSVRVSGGDSTAASITDRMNGPVVGEEMLLVRRQGTTIERLRVEILSFEPARDLELVDWSKVSYRILERLV